MIPRNTIDKLQIERQTDRTNVLRKRFENTIKISSTPAETIAFLVPHYPWNEKNIHGVEAFRPKVLRSLLGDIETSWQQFLPKLLGLAEDKFNRSLLYN